LSTALSEQTSLADHLHGLHGRRLHQPEPCFRISVHPRVFLFTDGEVPRGLAIKCFAEDGRSGIKRKAPPEWYTPRIDRKELRALMQRKNYKGFINVGLWLALMGVLGYLAAITMSSPWCILLFFAYGQVLGNASARWHECLHGTPFRTPVLNEIVFFFACALDFRDIIFTR
jgi:hypothetical protein